MDHIELANWISAGANVVMAICALLALRKYTGNSNRADHNSIAVNNARDIHKTN